MYLCLQYYEKLGLIRRIVFAISLCFWCIPTVWGAEYSIAQVYVWSSPYSPEIADTAVAECDAAYPKYAGQLQFYPDYPTAPVDQQTSGFCGYTGIGGGSMGPVMRGNMCPVGSGTTYNSLDSRCHCPADSSSTIYRYFSNEKKCAGATALSSSMPTSDPKGNSCNPDQPFCGDPINPGTGNNWQRTIDFAGVNGALTLTRTYNSSPFNTDADAVRSFGARWTYSYEAKRLKHIPDRPSYLPSCYRRTDNGEIFCEPFPPDTVNRGGVAIVHPDGKQSKFFDSGRNWVSDADVNDRIHTVYAADATTIAGWIYVSSLGDVTERFDANGLLLSTSTRAGATQRMTYSDGVTNSTSIGRSPVDAPVCAHIQAGAVLPPARLLCVTDTGGRQLQFEYDAFGRITKAIDPANNAYVYEYDGASGGCASASATNPACSANNLTKVIYPDLGSQTYHYNDAGQINGGTACLGANAVATGFGHLLNSLTGITDENGKRYTTWSYDCQGRTTGNWLAGDVAKVSLAYGDIAATGTTTIVSNTLGTAAAPLITTRAYHYRIQLGIAKNDSIDRPCAECGIFAKRTYDSANNISTTTDWNGVQTSYAYDLTRNLETSRTEAVGTPLERSISTEWHPIYRISKRIAAPNLLTTMTHDMVGNVLTRTDQPTNDTNGTAGFRAPVIGSPRTWTYTYNGIGQILTITGPRTDVVDKTTYTYDTRGNLATVTNPASQITKLSSYDPNGKLLSMTDKNGAVTIMTYAPRGWLLGTKTQLAGTTDTESTTYLYDGIGQITAATFSNGNVITYAYDDAHRLIAVADSTGNKITYILDNMGNRTNETVTDPSGGLVRSTTRVYDDLNRLQQVTGGMQ